MRLPNPSRDPKNDPYLRLPAGIMYSYSLSLVIPDTGKAMCVNCHQIVLKNIQMSFFNPCVFNVPLLYYGGGGVLTP